jgi:hypothetical protein
MIVATNMVLRGSKKTLLMLHQAVHRVILDNKQALNKYFKTKHVDIKTIKLFD